MLNDNSLKTERRFPVRRGHEHSKDMSAYRIRPAKEEDCEQIVKLIKVRIDKKKRGNIQGGGHKFQGHCKRHVLLPLITIGQCSDHCCQFKGSPQREREKTKGKLGWSGGCCWGWGGGRWAGEGIYCFSVGMTPSKSKCQSEQHISIITCHAQ